MKVSFRFVRPARSAGARNVVTSTLPRAAEESGVVPVATARTGASIVASTGVATTASESRSRGVPS